MNVLFIGGTGNISAECAALLYERGHKIGVVTRGRSSVPPQYQTILADRHDPRAMRTALSGFTPDIVVNFLGYEVPDVKIDYQLFNGSVQQYIFISSATVYAKPHQQLPITESAPLGNVWSEYAQKKLMCEQWLLERWKAMRFPVTIVRPSHTYSKIWVPNPVSSSSYTFAARIGEDRPVFVPDNGENPWTLTAASDFAIALAGLVAKEKSLGEAYHITSDEALTWNQIVQEIADALGVASPKVFKIPTETICKLVPELTGSLKGDKSNPGIFDNSKIKQLVPDFNCRKPFRVGIRESVAWLRAHPEQQNRSEKVEAMIDKVVREAT